jgi:hypothetical protein
VEGLGAIDEARKKSDDAYDAVQRELLLALIRHEMGQPEEARAALSRAREPVPKPPLRHWTEAVRIRHFSRLVEEALQGKKARR